MRAQEGELERIESFFTGPTYESLADEPNVLVEARRDNPNFAAWAKRNVARHKQVGYAIANISLKPKGGIPGDATDSQMELVADLADRYSYGEIRVTHEQNLVLAHVRQDALYELWQKLDAAGLGTANIGSITDMITCPGLDYCALATARSIPIAQNISEKFSDIERQNEIGDLKIKISGCINACGHHHAGNIGILGLDKKGEEYYQITLGGSGDENAAVGEILGPGFAADEVADAIDTIVNQYIAWRKDEAESFLDVVNRAGLEPFKEALYADH